MDFTSFSGALAWVIAHGYALMFVAMLIEGPLVTAAASFAAALGYFSLLNIFILSILGDLVADVAYYAIGYYTRLTLVKKYGHYYGLSGERLERFYGLLHTHRIKTLIALKLAPFIPTPGLILVGATHMPLREFTIINLLVIIPKTIFFMVIGYYFGALYDGIDGYVNYAGYFVVVMIILLLLVRYAFDKFSYRLSKKIEGV